MEDQVKTELDRLGYSKITIDEYLKELNRLKSLKLNKEQFIKIKERLLLKVVVGEETICEIKLEDDKFKIYDVYVFLRDISTLAEVEDYENTELLLYMENEVDGDDVNYTFWYKYPEDI